MSKRFDLGQVVVTAGVDAMRNENPEFRIFVSDCLLRYINGDWGDICDEDRGINEASIDDGEMIFAVYKFNDDITIDIQTEWDRSYTTIMFPHER